MTPRPLASLRGVEKRYRRGTLAVQGVDLDIMPGTFVALLGASGCGKSTLLRLIAGLETPSAGRIEWPTAAHDAAGRPERDTLAAAVLGLLIAVLFAQSRLIELSLFPYAVILQVTPIVAIAPRHWHESAVGQR